MKKILVSILAVAIIFGTGLVIKKSHDRAGEPPIGSAKVALIVHTDGEPPIGS